MWSLERLEKELGSLVQSKNLPSTIPVRAPQLRYLILRGQVDRLTCYDRALLVGLFRLRITLSCPSSKREPLSFESPQPFEAGRCLSPAEASFRIPIPVNMHGPPDQISQWRLEIEVLHKFPAAPIYSVIARSWVDPDAFARAKAIDVFSTDFGDSKSVCVRIDFLRSSANNVGISLFRTAGKLVLFIVKLAQRLRLARENQVVQIERQMKLSRLRAATEREQTQFALLNRTLDVMSTYVQSGSRPEDWIKSMQKAGMLAASDDEKRRIDAQIAVLRDQIEGLRNEVLKALIDRPPPVQYVQQVPPLSPVNVQNPPASSWWNSLTGAATEAAPQVRPQQPVLPPRDDGDVPEEDVRVMTRPQATVPPVQPPPIAQAVQPSPTQAPLAKPPGISPPVVVQPATAQPVSIQATSVSGPTIAPMAPSAPRESLSAPAAQAKTPEVPAPMLEPVPAQPAEEALTVEEQQEAEQGADEEQERDEQNAEEEGEPPNEEQPAEDLATAAANTVTSWWGALSTAVGGEPPPPEPKKTVPPKKATVSPVPKDVPVAKAPAVPKAGPPGKAALPTKPVAAKPVAKLNAAPLVKAVAAPKGKPVPKKPVVKVDPVKAKMMLIAKIKQLEVKRKAEIENTNKKITEFAKKIPPVDRTKFLGLPGPPPFPPKAKAKPEPSLLPTALGPPTVDADADPEALMEAEEAGQEEAE